MKIIDPIKPTFGISRAMLKQWIQDEFMCNAAATDGVGAGLYFSRTCILSTHNDKLVVEVNAIAHGGKTSNAVYNRNRCSSQTANMNRTLAFMPCDCTDERPKELKRYEDAMHKFLKDWHVRDVEKELGVECFHINDDTLKTNLVDFVEHMFNDGKYQIKGLIWFDNNKHEFLWKNPKFGDLNLSDIDYTVKDDTCLNKLFKFGE